MKLENWIEFREVTGIDMNELPSELYQWTQKVWTSMWLYYPNDLINELETIVEQYLRVMWLDPRVYPARVDLWFSEAGKLIIYEVTTGFVDQVWSCITLQEITWDQTGLSVLSKTNLDSSVLTTQPYKWEYELMKSKFERSQNPLYEGESNRTFVYWYPSDEMQGKENFIPWWTWLNAEEKSTQASILSRLCRWSSYMIPRYFSRDNQSYDELPQEKFSKLVFKQSDPKVKGERNTIVFWKWKQVERRYKDGEMIAQEYIPALRNSEWSRFESKVLFMPTYSGTRFTWMYLLEDSSEPSKNYGNMSIPNDGYPQWPWIIIP